MSLLSVRNSLIYLAIVAFVSIAARAQSGPVYKDSARPAAERAADLLQRMTLEEKVAQLGSFWRLHNPSLPLDALYENKLGELNEASMQKYLGQGLGEMARPSNGHDAASTAAYTNRLQRFVIEKTRLGIPILFHEECLHGMEAKQATIFPQAIALASSWDPALFREIFGAVAQEVRTRGGTECLMPVIDLARDPRWGRTEETYGEDPWLTGRLGVAAVEGMQGKGPTIDGEHVMATLKHFAVHSQPQGGTNAAPADYSERTVREYFLLPFEMAVKEAHARSVMPSYNELDGIPNHTNEWLLRTVLRGEWGFDGVVVSDYFALRELYALHHVAQDCAGAATLALKAGVEIELPMTDCYAKLPELVRSGAVSQSLIDEAVLHVLRQKFELGLFDHPYVDENRAAEVAESPEHVALARRAAEESIILLKNEDSLLPLKLDKLQRIAVIGPNAAELHLGGYSGETEHGVSILEGIRRRAAGKAEVVYAQGCAITESKPAGHEDSPKPPDAKLDEKRIAEAVALAKSAGVAVLVLGEDEQISREAWSAAHPGDRDDLNLVGRQDELLRRVQETGTPVVVILIHGRPLSIGYVAAHAPAIVDGWYLGQEGGNAMAAVLFGDYNPGGKLPVTVPRNVGQLPVFYNQKPTAKRGYVWSDKTPLYPFGYGLSYTSFHLRNLRVEPRTIDAGGSATVTVEVTNTGSREGSQVVQMYIRDEVSSVTRPVKELRGFERLWLKPGESRQVSFTLGPEELRFYNREMKRVVEPGEFTVMIGFDSKEVESTTLMVK